MQRLGPLKFKHTDRVLAQEAENLGKCFFRPRLCRYVIYSIPDRNRTIYDYQSVNMLTSGFASGSTQFDT